MSYKLPVNFLNHYMTLVVWALPTLPKSYSDLDENLFYWPDLDTTTVLKSRGLISLKINSFQDFFKPYSNYFQLKISLYSERFKQANAIKTIKKLL